MSETIGSTSTAEKTPRKQLSKGMSHLHSAIIVSSNKPVSSSHKETTLDTTTVSSSQRPLSESSDKTSAPTSFEPTRSSTLSATQCTSACGPSCVSVYGIPSHFEPIRRHRPVHDDDGRRKKAPILADGHNENGSNGSNCKKEKSCESGNNTKRSDPFQFGQRYLEDGDNIFAHNAWDHVEIDPQYAAFSEEMYARQRANPVSDYDRWRFSTAPEKWWDLFYRNNNANFFKNRKWLFHEFPILAELTAEECPSATGSGAVRILEVGAGAGNTAFPILEANKNPNLVIHACDFSKKAVDLIRSNPAYDGTTIRADVWDLAATKEVEPGTANASDISPTSQSHSRPQSRPQSRPEPSLPPGVAAGSLDIAILIFVFSALAPSQWTAAIRNIYTTLKPGGHVLFRDYSRGDLAQVRFRKGRWMEENFYVRGDGTRVYFFDRDELERLWCGDGCAKEYTGEQKEGVDGTEQEGEHKYRFEAINIGVDKRMLVNRQRKLKMYRNWIQAEFRKPAMDSETVTGVQNLSLEAM